MQKLYFEDRAWRGFRLCNKKQFEITRKGDRLGIYLEIGTHIGDFQLFALEEQYTYLDKTEGKTGVHPTYGGYVLFTWSLSELKDYIRTTYNKEPIFPKDLKERIAYEFENLQRLGTMKRNRIVGRSISECVKLLESASY